MAKKNVDHGLKMSGRIMLLVMMFVFILFFIATGVRFATIAHTGSVDGHDLLLVAINHQLGTGQIASRRGSILDRGGNVIVSQHPSYTMFANFHPDWGTTVDDVNLTASGLAQFIDMDISEILTILSTREIVDAQGQTSPIWQARFGNAGLRLNFGTKNRIQSLNLPGIYFLDDLTRFYQHGAFASHTIGYTIFGEQGEIIGVMGIEGFFNEELTGIDGSFQQQHDRFGIMQPGGVRHYITRPEDGFEIRLTLCEQIQIFLETALDEVANEVNVNNMTAVVMDAKTGEILATGSRPTFDPNQRDPEIYSNALIYPIEPGSTMKIFTYAAAINEGRYDGHRTFYSGERFVYDVRIPDHWAIPSAVRTFNEGFYVSTNTSIVDLLNESISLARFTEYLSAFGFGETTGLPLQNEHAGILRTSSPVDIFMSGFGQAIAVTPVQMLQAMTAMMGDGEMVRPQLIAEIYDPNTNTVIYEFEREIVGTPITAETARQMRELMRGVVESEVGTGRINYVLNVPSGGKTGTAQVPAPFGGYLQNVHIYSYIGFAPLDDPEIIMFVAIEKETIPPASGHPFVGRIYQFVMNNTLSYLGLTHEVAVDFEGIATQFERTTTPRIFNLPREAAVAQIEAAGLIPVVIGDRQEVFSQFPVAESSIVVGERVFIKTDVEDTLPDFTGWTRAQITQYANLLGLDITINGHGHGYRQTMRAGRIVRVGDALTVTLE